MKVLASILLFAAGCSADIILVEADTPAWFITGNDLIKQGRSEDPFWLLGRTGELEDWSINLRFGESNSNFGSLEIDPTWQYMNTHASVSFQAGPDAGSEDPVTLLPGTGYSVQRVGPATYNLQDLYEYRIDLVQPTITTTSATFLSCDIEACYGPYPATYNLVIDGFNVFVSVPEPSAFMFLGIAGALAIRKRRPR